MTGPEQKDYHSYLLRLWRVKGNGDSWRASLQEVQSGEVQGFTDLGALFAYLDELLEQEAMGRKQDQEGVAGQQDSFSDCGER